MLFNGFIASTVSIHYNTEHADDLGKLLGVNLLAM